MRIDRFGPILVALSLGIAVGGARAEAPWSAIDWLSQSLITPVAQPKPPEPGVAKGGALPEAVAVTTLDRASPDGVGILPAHVTGLPRNLWGLGKTDEIIAALQGPGLDALPALQGLMITLLLAEAEPPSDAGLQGRLLIARIDRLLAMGALDQARALIDAAGPASSPDLFRRSFDIAILTGGEDLACRTMTATPGLAPAMPARIFCLARSGDWQAAALTLQTAQALGLPLVSLEILQNKGFQELNQYPRQESNDCRMLWRKPHPPFAALHLRCIRAGLMPIWTG